MKQTVPELVRRFLALMLCAAMLLPMVAVTGHAEEITEPVAETTAPTEAADGAISALTEALATMNAGEKPLAVVYAASDFQPYKGSSDDVGSGKTTMNSIIDTMQAAGYTSVDGALICGDYSKVYNTWGNENVTKNNEGLIAVAEVLEHQWNLTSNLETSRGDDHVVYVQGNHDPANMVGLDASGSNDTANYGVYVLHEDDFQWMQGDSDYSTNAAAKTKETAAALKKYLKEKAAEKYDKPIFVCAHVPLHYGRRTSEKTDNIYAKYIFDVLNEYGKELDIIFLFGHDHSSTYDDYLGGGAIYLPVGDKIWIPNAGSSDSWTEYTLNFTYMNAGYLGYFEGAAEDSDGDDDTGLSSTIFEIYEDKVVVSRYDENSVENLKNKGVKASADTWAGAAANTKVYASAQVIKLKEHVVDWAENSLTSGKLATGNSGTLTVSGLYQKSYDVVWSSDNEEIATVVASESDPMTATITAVGAGTVKIKAVVTETAAAKSIAPLAEGDSSVLEYNLEVVDTASGAVILAEAGEHTYFILDDNQDSNTWAADTSKRYVIVSQDKDNPTAGKFMAMYYNGALDTAEGDESSEAWMELNAEPITVMELPINGQNVYAVSTNDDSFMWNFKSVDRGDDYNWYWIEPEYNRARALMLSRGHENAYQYDRDNDGMAIRNTDTGKSDSGNWRMSNRAAGLTALSNDSTSSNLYFAPYYDPIQGDFAAYYTQNGDENMGSRVYMYEETAITLESDIVAILSDKTGYVSKNVGTSAGTGDVIYVQSGNKTISVPVTVDMLTGSYDLTAANEYSGLTLTYAGVEIANDYTLVVQDATTLLKNEGGKFRSTIYRQTEEMVGGRHYLIVDTAQTGEAHAMGAPNSTTNSTGVTAHNVLIQSFTVDGEEGLYIDSTRYSDSPDTPTSSIIEDQGNVNANISSADHKAAIRLVWTPSILQAVIRNGAYQYVMSNDMSYRLLVSEYHDGRLWVQESGNYDKPVMYWGGSTSSYEQWKYVPTGSGTGTNGFMLEGLTLTTSVSNYRLFYNFENFNGNYADKNFITEGNNTTYNPKVRRTWLYEQVDDIDTITARLDHDEGVVTVNCNASATTGDYILVETYGTDGSVEVRKVPVRVSMLSGNLDTTKVDTYTGLTLTYEGKVITNNYTLHVEEFVPNDYPEFPDEGAVRIDKQLDTTKYKYLDTGVASIDLSVTGVPSQTGVDIIFILDTSSSMERCIHHVKKGDTCGTCGYKIEEKDTRLGLLKETMVKTLQDLQAPIDGYAPDIDVAVACFNGYTPIDTDLVMYSSSYSVETLAQYSRERMDSSNVSLNFTNVASLTATQIQAAADGLYRTGGTNFDRGIEIAYNMLKAKQEENTLNGETREQVLVFMSDGTPYQFNYVHGDHHMARWNDYLQGNLENTSYYNSFVYANNDLFKQYYNTDGKHWMTEAIKGDPNQKYKIINPDLQDSNTKIEYVNGLGATVYTVGMGIYKEGEVVAASCNHVLLNMASPAVGSKKYFYSCTSANQFTDAFDDITATVRRAGNAVFHDQMGPQFDLVTSNKIDIINDVGVAEVVDLSSNPPTITVKSYKLYKRSEIGKTVDGVVVTETMVGSRKPGEPAVLETITFNDDGSVVSSDKKSGNILNGKVIEAVTFFYNTDKVNAVNITVNGETVSLAPETFYWNIGNIPEEELVLSYSVYLNGSMEGTRPQGTYDTNNYAELTYTNYLGNNCKLSVPTPKLPWNQGTVGYAFYLVNSKGEPIVNQSTGEVGSFENSVRITEAVYKDFYLNSVGEDIMAEVIEAENVMPEGYTLFDTGAQYEVMLDSNGTGYYDVTVGADVNGITTTYVQGVDSSAIKPVGRKHTTDYVTANTIVWFAVVAETKAVPDVVVIDYGLPVDINVLYNDTMMGDYGKLAYVGPTSEFAEYNESTDGKLWEYLQNNVAIVDRPKFETETVNGENGVITVQKSEGESTGILRYTLNESNGMKMKDEETFVYAVEYTGGIGAKGYYYSTVTIIPATSIYYEDNFVEYVVKNYETADTIEDKAVQWTQVGRYGEVTQAEDRPGEYSPGKIDANNIYGYDGAYTDMAEYSMNNYHKVTVGKQTLSNGTDVVTYANAIFSFSGTGFDIVSVTSDKTGTIVVKVNGTAAADGSTVSKNYMVDTYYGFYFDGENWIVDKDDTYPEGKNALYQIPVIKVADLPYGDYKVTISASHKELYDHGQYDGTKYDFYLDAIRIYDPANDGEGNKVIEDAYKADGEGWPSYQELRNMVISAEDFNALEEGDQTNGLIFIDNTDGQNGKEYSISDYKSYGPNNELYLAPGQAVSFVLEAGKYTENGATMYGKNIAGIHLALKSVNGDTIAKIFDGEKFKAEEVSGDKINTATDLYYDITDLNGKTVVIYNAGNSILSITNIKTTYLSDPMGQNATVLMMSRGAASVALLSLNPVDNEPDVPEVPETSEPEVPETSKPEIPETSEPEVPETSEPEGNEEFEPAKFRINLDKNKAKVGDTVVITVTTSRDVDHITVNGEQITKYSTNFRKTERTWRVRVKLEEVGQLEVSVVCYDKDENASAPATKIIEVTEKNNGSQGSGTGSSLRDLLDLFFGFFR